MIYFYIRFKHIHNNFICRREKFKKPVKIEHRRNENEIVLEISNSPSSVNMSGVIFLEYGNKLYYKIRDKNVYDTGRLFLEKENQIILPPFIGECNNDLIYILFLINLCRLSQQQYM